MTALTQIYEMIITETHNSSHIQCEASMSMMWCAQTAHNKGSLSSTGQNEQGEGVLRQARQSFNLKLRSIKGFFLQVLTVARMYQHITGRSPIVT